MAHLITGYQGAAHITASDQGAFNAGVIGSGDYVMLSGNQFAAEIISNNTIRINDGDAVMQGRHFNIASGQYEEVTIANGMQGMKRYDLIVARYSKDTGTGVESVELDVVQGISTSGTPSEPTPTTGNILEGATLHEMPLYRVYLNGLTVESVTPLYKGIGSLSDLILYGTAEPSNDMGVEGSLYVMYE